MQAIPYMVLASPEGTHANSRESIEGVSAPSRGAAVYAPRPIVFERGRGSRVWDLDGSECADFMMTFGALIQGHAHPKIVEVVTRTMGDSSRFATAALAEGEDRPPRGEFVDERALPQLIRDRERPQTSRPDELVSLTSPLRRRRKSVLFYAANDFGKPRTKNPASLATRRHGPLGRRA